MADNETPSLAPLSAEHRKICAAQFERANQVIASGNYDYGIQLLLSCCKLDPGNLIYRQTLRRTEKTKYKNNLRGSRFAWLTNSTAWARVRSAKRSREYLKVLEAGEEVLARNPWDIGAQLDMAEAADALGLLDLAVWTLEQARQKDPTLPALNRSLARLLEKRGNFAEAIALWELVRKKDPSDIEANHKSKDLAASETIQRAQNGNLVGVFTPNPGDEKPEEAKAAHTKQPAKTPFPNQPADRLARDTAPIQARIQADPTKPANYLDLVVIYRRNNQLDRAREVLKQGLAATGNYFQLALELTELELEPFRQNLVHAEEKLRADPDNAELRQIRAGLRKEINTRELELFRMKADRFPMDLSHRLELGTRLLRAGQLDEAIKELQAARTDNRYTWRALLWLGHCFRNRDNWRLARRNFEDCLQAMPAQETTARKEVLFLVANGCAEAGELAEAVELGHELANIDFAYRDIGRLLDEWQARLQQV